MPPPYTLTSAMLTQVAEIAGAVGRLEAIAGTGKIPLLRREDRIRSIHSSLAIENNTLSLEQVTAVIAGKRVLGPPQEVHEVKNAFAAYEAMPSWNADSSKDLLAAILTALREASATDPVADPVTDQVAALLRILKSDPLSATDGMTRLKLSHRPTFRANYLNPALAAGLIERTVPDKPNSRPQKYRLTAKGRRMSDEG